MGENSRPPNRNECRFCYEKGHYQIHCPLARKVQRKQGLKKQWKEQAHNVEEVVETSKVALAEEYDSNLYYLQPTFETASLVTHDSQWALDSGASWHFTGILSDFVTLKRWSTERSVRIANGSFIPAIGHGVVQLPGLQLYDVWFVPQFKTTRLVSVRTLT